MDQNLNNQTPPPPTHDMSASQTVETETHAPKPKRHVPWLKIFVFGIVGIITLAAFGLIAYLLMGNSLENQTKEITSYEECVAAGYPIQETYPEKCTVPGTASFTRELTPEEIKKLNPGVYEGDDFSFEYPTETFALAHLVCINHSPDSPMLIEKNADNNYSNVGCVYGIVFDVKKVDEIYEELSDNACYSNEIEQILIDEKPATAYTSTFIGGDVERCTEGKTGMISESKKLIYVEDEEQLYLIQWPIHDYIDQSAYDQILSTFKFTDTETTVDTSDWKTYEGIDFSIKYPGDFEVQNLTNQYNQITDNYTNSVKLNNSSENYSINIYNENNTKNLNANELLNIYINSIYDPTNTKDLTGEYVNEKINNNLALFETGEINGVYTILGFDYDYETVLATNKNKLYVIQYSDNEGGKVNEEQQYIVNQILSTLEFTP